MNAYCQLLRKPKFTEEITSEHININKTNVIIKTNIWIYSDIAKLSPIFRQVTVDFNLNPPTDHPTPSNPTDIGVFA